MQLKAGTRRRSAVDACEVVVMRAPGEPVDLRCGGHPFRGVDEEATAATVVAGSDEGTQLAKRYADEGIGLEVLGTKAGARSLAVGGAILEVKGAKPLPASD